MISVGYIIKKAREMSKVKSQELADLCKISRQTLSHIENDRNTPTMDVFIDICTHLPVDVCEALKVYIDQKTKMYNTAPKRKIQIIK